MSDRVFKFSSRLLADYRRILLISVPVDFRMAKSAVHGAPKVQHSRLSSVTEVARPWLQAGLGGHSQQGFKRLRRCSGARLSVGGGGMRDRAPGAEFL